MSTASPLPVHEESFSARARGERVAAILGIALGVTFSICFVTGVLSHFIQEPGSWFTWPARPAGLYRFTQGLHIASGIASIPLLLAKLWVVYPTLFTWPPVQSLAHALERLMLLPLIGASLLLLFTGVANINIWRPWDFSFRPGHYAAAWIAIGALVVHVGAKWVVIRSSLRGAGRHGADDTVERVDGEPAEEIAPPDGLDRRALLGAVFATSGLLTLFTIGQTFAPLRRLALLAPRRPDVGPQGFPVNRTAASVGLREVDLASYRLVVDGPGTSTPLELTLDELRALPQREATLPIACVEGWSTSQTWRGVPVRDLLRRAGAREGADAVVHAIHASPRLRTSPLNPRQTEDADTLLALEVNGEPLDPDHGFPARLVGPNRPGVHQTKWVGRIEVLA